jgi:hypothetical protein
MPALFIVLGLAVVVFIAAAGHQKHPARRELPAAGLVVELDRGMPPSVVAQVLTALGEEGDPARLDDLGTSLAVHYPLAASELHAKAMQLRVSTGAAAPIALPAAAPPAVNASPAPAASAPPVPAESAETGASPAPQLDAAAVLQAAMRALVEETDPVVLDGFAASIRGPYPTAAEILSTRAQALRASAAAGGQGPRTGSGASAPATTPSAAPGVSS